MLSNPSNSRNSSFLGSEVGAITVMVPQLGQSTIFYLLLRYQVRRFAAVVLSVDPIFRCDIYMLCKSRIVCNSVHSPPGNHDTRTRACRENVSVVLVPGTTVFSFCSYFLWSGLCCNVDVPGTLAFHLLYPFFGDCFRSVFFSLSESL